MKLILSNYRYFMSGGPEKYLFAIESLLRSHGHQVSPFSVRSAHNQPCEHQERFLSPIGDETSVYAHEVRKTPRAVLQMLARQFYCPEAFLKARSFGLFTGADLVYSLQFLNKMSPALLDGFKSAGLPVVQRISDFGLICPQAHLFDGQAVCEKCVDGNFLHAMLNGCVAGSKAGGLVKGLALALHRLLGCRSRIDAYVFPSRHTLRLFARAGFPQDRLHYVPTCIDAQAIDPRYDTGEYILYFGRLVVEKGVRQLLEAYRELPADKPRLVCIGARGGSGYADALMKEYQAEADFLDFMPKEELAGFVRKALCVVVPSIWYDNLPNVLLEAYAHGKPVIAPRHGSFLDVVRDGETGLFFKAGDPDDLREKLAWAVQHPEELQQMGRAGRRLVEREFSPEGHYKALMDIFSSARR